MRINLLNTLLPRTNMSACQRTIKHNTQPLLNDSNSGSSARNTAGEEIGIHESTGMNSMERQWGRMSKIAEKRTDRATEKTAVSTDEIYPSRRARHSV